LVVVEVARWSAGDRVDEACHAGARLLAGGNGLYGEFHETSPSEQIDE